SRYRIAASIIALTGALGLVACGSAPRADAATDAAAQLSGGAFEPHGGDSDLSRCQKSIVKASGALLRARSKSLAKCWSAVDKGNAAAPCPDPGDGKAAAAIEKARGKFVASVCKACGGGDGGCDDAAGGVVGTGGSDDVATSVIGFAGTCPDVKIPGAMSSCSQAVTTLGGLVDCVLCDSEFEGRCVDVLAVPWSQSYPAECLIEDDDEPCEAVVHDDDFTLADASAWPAPWTEQPNVAFADVQAGRARLRPTLEPAYSLARMTAALPEDESDVEVTFTFEFGDTTSQGIGFYVRQNGGHLQLTPTHGQGYAVFIEGYAVFGEGGGQQGIGLWKEVDGVEIPLLRVLLPAATMLDGVRYRARLRVNQAGPDETWLRARLWPEADPEPAAWQVEFLDSDPVLQHVAGGLAVDSWSRYTTGDPGPQGDTFVDDIEVTTLCNPLAGLVSAPALVADDFMGTPFEFTEGPRWRPDDGVLLFTDINLETIYQLTPPGTVAEFRTGSNAANGLANDINGDLLACEHATRRVSRTDSMSAITTVTGDFSGDQYHSPNDLAVRSDGTIYFTDPQYGMGDHGQPAELGFNGLFRVAPGGAVTAEWMGGLGAGPNGLVLSPDEDVLYMSDTSTGQVLAWDVNPDGSLTGESTFASGLTTPDGMCMDSLGNLFVSQWGASAAAGSIEVYDADGQAWGSIPVGHSPTNCGFGAADARTLYITAHEGFMSNQAALYALDVPLPGLH
ncbi:MAG: SMP-30/gluconolactonase/LRE family protein, partial [Candidatus Binatia bacterium]